MVSLPPLVETILVAPLTNIQAKLYKSLLTRDISVFEKNQKSGLLNGTTLIDLVSDDESTEMR